LKKTVLYKWHENAGAKFAPFAGYEMPINYGSGALEEHRLTRRSVALFDISHMGQLLVSGPGAGEALSPLVSSRILDMGPGAARYALLLSEQGGILDDLFIYKLPKQTDSWFIVANASNKQNDIQRLRELLPPTVNVQDLSIENCMIAVQGPRAVELIDRISDGALSKTERFSMTEAQAAGIPAKIGRTGYTGEDGAEIYYSAEKATELWQALLDEAKNCGIEAGPAGLAARDSLRFEAGMPLHGHEISPDIRPQEALLSWACDWEKDFIGKDSLLMLKQSGLRKKLVTINVSGGVPREGYSVLDTEGIEIGSCVSGMFCPTTGTYSANAFVPPAYSAPGARLQVSIRGKLKEADVIKRPLYIPSYRR